MDNMKDKIIDYLEKQLAWKAESLCKMDKRHKIPKKIQEEIDELGQMISFLCRMPLIEAKHKSTGMFDDNKNPIFVGDTLRSEHGYDVVVSELDGDFFGKLICEDNHTCKDIPYALNGGKGYLKTNYFRF